MSGALKMTLISLLVLGLGCKKSPAPLPVTPTPSLSPIEVSSTLASPEPELVEPERVKPDRKALLTQVNDAVALLTVGSEQASSRALALLKSVVQNDDTLVFAHFNMGVAHQQLNQLGAARMAYERALDVDQTLAIAWLAVGLLQDIAGNPSRAIVKYRQGLEYAPDDIDLYVALIGSLRRQNRLGDAVETAKEALKINANSLAIYNELGLVYLRKNDLGMARFVYVKAFSQVEGAKNNAAIRCHLGRVLYLQGEEAQAARELDEAYALDPKYFSTLVYLAEIHFDNRAYDKAVPLLEEARRQQPDHHGVAINMGLAYRGIEKYAEAQKLYEDAIRIDGGNADPYMNLGILYADYTKQYDAAIASFNRYLSDGGLRRKDAQEYIAKVEKERQRASKKKRQDADRKQREADRDERERLLKEAEEKARREAEADTPAKDPTLPAEEETSSPWEET